MENQNTTPESDRKPVKITTAKINGHNVLITSGSDGSDFDLHRMPSKINTKAGLSQSIFDDPVATIGLGVCLLIGTGLITFIFMAILKPSGSTQAASEPYRPMPYSVTTEKCKPSGFLWLGETCNTTKETGYR